MNILFIDIGSYSIKSLYFCGKYRGLYLKEYLITPTKKEPGLSKLEQVTSALAELRTKHSYFPDKVYVTYPTDRVISKYLQVPFKDRKRIQISLPFELEDLLPFEIKNVIFDWRLVERLGKISNIFTYVTTKTDLSMYIDAMEVAGFEPDYIVPNSDAFINILERLNYLNKKKFKDKTDEDIALETTSTATVYLDIGFNKTNVFICVNNKIKHIRTIPYGGDYVTKCIQEELCLDYFEAESLKIKQGDIASEDEDQDDKLNNLSSIIRHAYDFIIRDINQTISYFKASEKISVQNGFLLGSGWRVQNFNQYLNKELKINFFEFKYLDDLKLNFKFAEESSEAILHNAVGLSLLQLDKNLRGINFRKGEFSKSKKSESVNQTISLLKPSIFFITASILCFLIFGFINSFILNKSIGNYKEQIQTKMETAFYDLRPSQVDSFFENLEKLDAEVLQRLELQKTILDGNTTTGDPSALKILNSLSASFPKDKTVDVVELIINKNVVKISKAIVPNGAVVKDIIDGLERSGYFKEIKQGNIRIAVDGVNKEFDLTATYKGK